MKSHFAALWVAAFATHALADGSTSTQINCPAGTEQRQGRESKSSESFCVKAGSTPQNPEMHGPYVSFWPNGQRQAEGQHKDGFRTGRWAFYDANGVKTGETHFEANDYHGSRIEYHANGKKKLEQTWVKGKREGVEVFYSANGQKVSAVRYAADKPVVAQ